jgi:hypothetical protein
LHQDGDLYEVPDGYTFDDDCGIPITPV